MIVQSSEAVLCNARHIMMTVSSKYENNDDLCNLQGNGELIIWMINYGLS